MRKLRTVCVTGLVMMLCMAMLADAASAQKKRKTAKKPEIPVPKRTIGIAPVDDSQTTLMQHSAATIDRLVEANYRRQGMEPNPDVSDEVFVRRAHLDIVGTIPEPNYARSFILSRAKDKRERLIDRLLKEPGYASHMYNYWANLLRLADWINNNNIPGAPYIEWVRKCCEENKSYDEFVYEMLTAEGKITENPAAGYILRDSGMPLDGVNNTVRLFLGTQVGCAQCHDHPFDRWTQKEFYQMAAFTYGVNTRIGARDKMFGGGNIVQKMRDELKTVDEKFDGGGKYNKFLIGNLIAVSDSNRQLTLPHDYQYDDAKPKSRVEMKTIFDPQPEFKNGETPRIAMAKWMISRDNPRFTRTIVNRMWKRAFGVGLIEPVDDMRDDTVASNPELMEFLISEMHRLDFNLKEFMRILYNTKVYQREASLVEYDPAVPYHFPGPVLRRMTPEQVWDSFITIATQEPDEYQAPPAEILTTLLKVDLAEVSAEEIYQRDQELRKWGNYRYRKAREEAYRHEGLLLVRASELPQPVPPGHFLRQFGQSDREVIDGNFDGGSVPQVLQMFNGPLTHLLLHEKSLLCRHLARARSVDDGIEIIFLSILSRFPSGEEFQAAKAEIEANGSPGIGNVIWALVNTREYLFVQ